jgi:hypothetical protein
MKVGLISNWDVQCGNAEYGRALCHELRKEFEVVELPPDTGLARKEISLDKDIRLVIINWHGGRVQVRKEDTGQMQDKGVKVIVIDQNCTGGAGAVGFGADGYVAHEPAKNIRYSFIPHGIPEVETSKVLSKVAMVGTAGFPFPWKRYDVVAEVAKKFNIMALMIAPKSDQMNTDVFMDGIKGHIPGLALIHREWLPTAEVVRMLSECVLNIFWFQSMDSSDELGQSGSVRLGIAAKRPTIISTHRKLKTLWKYDDELYICPKEEDVYKAVEEILLAPHLAKIPDKILKEQGWSVTGKQYRELVKELDCNS